MFDLHAFLALVLSPILGMAVVFNAWRSKKRVESGVSLVWPSVVLGLSLVSWLVVLLASFSQWGLWATWVFFFAAFGAPWGAALSSMRLGPVRALSAAHLWLYRSTSLFSLFVFAATLARGIYERLR